MNEVTHAKFGMGASVLRKEDNAFITGKGQYTDDKYAENVLHGYVLRSPMAHARFKINDTSDANNVPGVHVVLTAADVSELNPIPCLIPLKQPDGSMSSNRDIPILCDNIVRHVGDAIAFIVADSVAIARDAAEMIDVDFEMLPAVVDTVAALDDGSPDVYSDGDKNLAFTHFMGDREKTDELFKSADQVTELTIVNNRVISNYMETRACQASWDEGKNRYDVTVGSQGVFGMRRALAGVMGVDVETLHVMTPDVGGGFGTKVFCYREYPLCLFAAKKLGRPVKWTSDRGEHFVSDAQGRDNVVTARMAMDKDGKFLAMDVDLIAAMGAYLHSFGPFIPYLGITMTTGLYDIETMAVRIRGSYTNTVPTDAYRGAGRPEAAYLLERLVDKCAFELGLSPDEIRRRNLIKPEQLPYTTPGGRMYDTGEYQAHMELCMERADWSGFEDRLSAAKEAGKIRGIGMGAYIEACAFAGSEPAFIELNTDGTVDLKIGTQSNGQGHATAYTQLAAEKLGLDYEKIQLRQGDTDELENGGGTGGSRSIPLGGVSVSRASEQLAEKIKTIAAEELEASAADIELEDGEARIVGTDRVISFADIAAAAKDPDELKGEGEFKQAEATYPNGTHICEVEIDPETGVVEIIKYTVVDDFGVTLNPVLLEGQVHGGIAQSIGQVLTERVVYDDEGQLLTASFMDYNVPKADAVPGFDFETRNVPSTTNALGIKGAGEAGTIGATPAVMNAVIDALRREYGITEIDMPVTPSRLWEAIQGK
ncbi:MAG: xanthine dehydrogenase family protein molybdopterin-binding subunit [Rhizobiaceae bacterium]|nr:xanthine dehydrogenase family protein molybdopterin-binding subunit [Rhizobiaceae bacterium]